MLSTYDERLPLLNTLEAVLALEPIPDDRDDEPKRSSEFSRLFLGA
jgi:hypothetical protein